MSPLPPFLEQRTDGAIVFAGHRIELYHLVSYYNEGYSAEMLLEQFPTLSLSVIHKCIAFYIDNKPAVDAYCAGIKKALDHVHANGRQLDVMDLRNRLAQREKVQVGAGS